MKNDNNDLLAWYDKILNEEEGLGTFTVPVLQNQEQQEPSIVQTQEPPEGDQSQLAKDPVVQKDKGNSLVAFVIAKKIQDILVRVAGLEEPYESDSEERQMMVDKLKKLYEKLGEHIGSL